MLLGALGVGLLENILTGKRIPRAGYGNNKRTRNCKSCL